MSTRKMDLLESAHGLLCNAPSDGTDAKTAEQWYRLRRDWIDRYHHVLSDHLTKKHNQEIGIGNDAISRYQEQERMLDG